MKTIRLLLACAALCGLATAPAFAQGTAFTYQGVLSQGGAAVSGSNDLTFTLYDAVSGGSPVGTSNVVSDLRMTNGLFTVTLDFGAVAFDGTARWLQIAARPGASTGAYTNLVPRQPITATPYAIYAGGANAAALSGTISDARLSANVALRSGGNNFTGQQVVTLGGVQVESGAANTAALLLSSAGPGHGSGVWFENRSGGDTKTWSMYAGAAGGMHLGYQTLQQDVLYLGTNRNVGIRTSTPARALTVNSPDYGIEHTDGTVRLGTFINPSGGWLGTISRHALNFFVNDGGSSLTVSTNGNLGIGTINPGAKLHVAGSGFFGSESGLPLLPASAGAGVRIVRDSLSGVGHVFAYDYFSSSVNNLILQAPGGNVGIGVSTPATKLHVNGATTITGNHTVSGSLVVDSAGSNTGVISGSPGIVFGSAGSGEGIASKRTAGGNQFGIDLFTGFTPRLSVRGNGNVGIGTTNPAASLHVLGSGFFGNDSGGLPASAGAGVRIFHDTVTGVGQVFAYNYGTGSATDLVLQHAGGNVGIGTATPATKLDVAGEVTTTAVNITSDRNAKERFKPVNARDVLAKVARLPISEWQYKEHSDARHIGPMAQDFHAAFSVGRDEKHITTVDADGVALAAIQGLNEKLEEQVREKDTELGRLKAENQSLAERLAVIERALGLRRESAPEQKQAGTRSGK